MVFSEPEYLFFSGGVQERQFLRTWQCEHVGGSQGFRQGYASLVLDFLGSYHYCHQLILPVICVCNLIAGKGDRWGGERFLQRQLFSLGW
ncbi:hypothetical protein HA466_0142030 [Hirschfeldia incana]|nr:hypothetical protein HA466_0142030 [Hirschfeldia incana]